MFYLAGRFLRGSVFEKKELQLLDKNIGRYLYIGIIVRVFAIGLGDLGSITGRVIPKTQKMVLDATMLNTQHYKVRIKGKVVQCGERSNTLPYTLL